MKKLLSQLALSLMAAALVACGGGTSAPFPPSIQSSSLAYGKQATFYVGVTTLNPGTTFSATNCSALQSVTSTVANTLAYRCTISAAGALVFTGTDANGNTIATQSFTVPYPQVLIVTSAGSFVVELNPNKAPSRATTFCATLTQAFTKTRCFTA